MIRNRLPQLNIPDSISVSKYFIEDIINISLRLLIGTRNFV